MQSAQQSFIVAVGGHSGAGKTTLVQALVQELGDAVSLSFDDYYPNRVPSTRHPADLAQWLVEGARAEDWSTPQMAADLQALVRGESIELPGGKGTLKSAAFIILDEPFGRARPMFHDLIHFVIALDTPLEIGLTRRILRETRKSYYQEHPGEFFATLQTYLRNYLTVGRAMYRAIDEHARKDCDLLLDGLKPTSEIAREAAECIRAVSSVRTSRPTP